MTTKYTSQPRFGQDLTALMRRINVLQPETLHRSWTAVGYPEGGFRIVGSEIYYAAGTQVEVRDLQGVLIRSWTLSASGIAGGIDVLDGEVFVSNFISAGEVQVYYPDGTFKRSWSTRTMPANMGHPRAIRAFDSKVWVSGGNARVYIFDINGNIVGSLNSGGLIGNPVRAIDIYNNEVYVTTGFFNTVNVYNIAGVLQRTWGSFGIGGLAATNGKFNATGGISATSAGVFVSDPGNGRIQLFNTAGTFIRKFIAASGAVNRIDIKGNEVFDYGAALGLQRVFWQGTEFFLYQTATTKSSFGKSDFGVTIPALNGYDDPLADAAYPNPVLDMRNAVEIACVYYKNVVTGNAFNFTASSADNLHNIAVIVADYNTTAKDDWERTEAQMIGTETFDVDIGAIDDCVTKLEASALV